MNKPNSTGRLIVTAFLVGLMSCSAVTAMAATSPGSPSADVSAASDGAVRPAGVGLTQTLWPGQSGEGVSRIQQQLRSLGYFTYPRITGYFGPITLGALHAFERAYGYAWTGGADSGTRWLLTRAVTMKNLAADTVNYTGVPYVWGGDSPQTGFDCSGFVYFMYHTYGLSLQRLTSEDYFAMGQWIDRAHLEPGDLVFFDTDGGTASHVGFYLGGGKFISATSSRGIWTYRLDNPYWAARYNGARRI